MIGIGNSLNALPKVTLSCSPNCVQVDIFCYCFPISSFSFISFFLQGSYDTELQALHELIQRKVVTLLSDPENIVKQTLLENGITQLCVFFGRQKANDVLLSHMITFLNDKQDWQLRGAFFDSIVGVAAYVGWQSLVMLRPLLEQVRNCCQRPFWQKARANRKIIGSNVWHKWIKSDFLFYWALGTCIQSFNGCWKPVVMTSCLPCNAQYFDTLDIYTMVFI